MLLKPKRILADFSKCAEQAQSEFFHMSCPWFVLDVALSPALSHPPAVACEVPKVFRILVLTGIQSRAQHHLPASLDLVCLLLHEESLGDLPY